MPHVHPDLETIFRCDDQSALIDNYVASQDPPPGAWSRHASPQSPLGRVSFPEVLVLARGDVLTRGGDGKLVEHMLTEREWTPWLYTGTGADLTVARAVTQDRFAAHIASPAGEAAFLVLECSPASA